MGDFVLSLPAMERLRADCTEVWAASPNLPLARFAQRARSIAATGLDLVGIQGVDPPASVLEALGGFDSIVSWYGANRPEFRQEVERLGLPFAFLEALPGAGVKLHAADFYMRQVSHIAGGCVPAVPAIHCPAGEGGFAAIHPFSGSPKKNWPLPRFRQLAAILEQFMPVRWILDHGQFVEGAQADPPVDDLYELACKLAQARVYVGNDSGVTHLAAASGARVVALFGPSDASIWGPRGRDVRILQAGDSMDLLTVEEVARAVLGAVT